MPLVTHEMIGHDDERLAVKFSMLNDGQIVQCQISDLAMDVFAGTTGTENSARILQFLTLRDAIEELASNLFDERPVPPDSVLKIFAKHVRPR